MDVISDREFSQFQKLLFDITGISLSAAKKPLVVSRLSRRLREHQLSSYSEYFKLLGSNTHPRELQMAVDLLTTNETYFFREPKHFEFLHKKAVETAKNAAPFRVWSAACSYGQEPYTIAMVLADALKGKPWEVLASDISTRVLDSARKGQYPIEQAQHISRDFLGKYCLKGVGSQAGTLLIDRSLRERVEFIHLNLNTTLPRMSEFNVIFLRNVMIYFEMETKREVVKRLYDLLAPGGYLIVGHSETLNGVSENFRMEIPSVYKK